MLKSFVAAAAAAALALAAGTASAQNEKVRISFNPQIYSYLPIMLAIDKGYFAAEKLDIDVSTYAGSALSQIPMLARGDQDIAGMVAGPGFFNQHAEKFGIKLISSVAHSRPGWHDTMWVMLRKDIADSGAIKEAKDLKGRPVEGGPPGSPINITMKHLLQQGGLTLKDVQYGERLRAVTDVLPLFRNKAIEAIVMVEPIVGRLESEGLATRWKPSHEVMPWFQESYLAANPKYLTEKRDVTKRFLKVYLKGAQEVHATGGKWTPELIKSVAKWAKIPEEMIAAIPGPQHVGQFGTIDTGSIERLQNFFHADGIIKTKAPVAELVDTSIMDEVRKEAGIR